MPVPDDIQPASLRQLIFNMTKLSPKERPTLPEVYLTLQDIHAELLASGSAPKVLDPVSGVPTAVSAQVQLGRYHQTAPSFMAPSFKVLKKVTNYLDRFFAPKPKKQMPVRTDYTLVQSTHSVAVSWKYDAELRSEASEGKCRIRLTVQYYANYTAWL